MIYDSQSRFDMRIAPEASDFADFLVSAIVSSTRSGHASSGRGVVEQEVKSFSDKLCHY